ncbi:hypothetical protein F183_A32210 [Bryobacterales bacterium F-183]|nr:hypothetical protein F183_A32210 [Bryobacterales bacterium F-183]
MWRYLFAVLLAGAPAFACSCSFSDATVREVWKARPYVFLGTVVAAVPDTDQSYIPHVAHIRVDEAFKGVQKGEMLDLEQGGTSCDAHFRSGQRYVFYLAGTRGRYQLPWCSIALGSPDPEGEDLLFLNGLPATAKGTRLSAVVYSKWGSVPGAPVTITGSPSMRPLVKKTNSAGVVEFYGLPPGEYKVRVAAPTGYRVEDGRPEVESSVVLKNDSASGHTYARLDYDTSISGTVLTGGAARVELIPVSPVPGRNRAWLDSGRPSEDGTFAIKNIEPGSYWLRVTLEDRKNPRFTSTLYYPNVRTRANAKVITIESARKLQDMKVALPADEPMHTIHGRFTYSDGKAVAEARVVFRTAAELDHLSAASTDDDGAFRLRVPAGLKGTVHGALGVFDLENRECPQFEHAESERQGIFRSLQTPNIPLDESEADKEVNLQFPFPSCPAHDRLRNKK